MDEQPKYLLFIDEMGRLIYYHVEKQMPFAVFGVLDTLDPAAVRKFGQIQTIGILPRRYIFLGRQIGGTGPLPKDIITK
jgi:hypothetical protein